jgi:hypothetical protein
MKGFVKRLIKLIRDEKGQALILTLILLVIGGLTITPLLGLMGTGLLTGQVYESKMHELYAADAGVEDGLWQIKNEQLGSGLFGPDDPNYDPYAYYNFSSSYEWDYSLPSEVNSKAVTVNITNVWIPKDIPAPDSETAREIIEEGKLIITGSPSLAGGSQYEIKISYSWNCSNDLLLDVNTIGIWLPPGFEYAGNCSLEGEEYYTEPDVTPHKGGYAVVWNFASVRLSRFPSSTSGSPLVITFTFKYIGSEGQNPDNAVSWIDTSGVPSITYTWDGDVKIYKINSTATDPDTEKQTTVESYTSRVEMRKLRSAVSGDYVAVGNSLLTPTGDVNYRDQLYMKSSATIQSDDPDGAGYIPPDATVQAAFLYWSGWIDCHYCYKSGSQWQCGEIPELNYDNYAPNNLTTLVETNARVNTVTLLFGSGDPVTVPANNWQIFESTSTLLGMEWEGTWIYNCRYDATNLVKQLIADEKLEPNGSGTYTVKHAVVESRPGYDTYSFPLFDTGQETGYPLGTPAQYPGGDQQSRYTYSHAGWSLIIIYSSPETEGHQLYLYDIDNPNFKFREAWGPSVAGGIDNPDFDGDGSPGGTISGFLVPQPVEGEVNAAKITCFVGEGDLLKEQDYMQVNGESLPDGTGVAWWNVWNSESVGLTVPGVDIDTFYVTWSSGILESGDTSAQVDLPTKSDGFTLIYIILSFRSETTSGGVMGFLIK